MRTTVNHIVSFPGQSSLLCIPSVSLNNSFISPTMGISKLHQFLKSPTPPPYSYSLHVETIKWKVPILAAFSSPNYKISCSHIYPIFLLTSLYSVKCCKFCPKLMPYAYTLFVHWCGRDCPLLSLHSSLLPQQQNFLTVYDFFFFSFSSVDIAMRPTSDQQDVSGRRNLS